MTSARKSGLHYAWIILAAACVLSIVSRADSSSFAVFVDPLADKFDWKRGDISLAYSLAFLCSMPAMLVFGWLGDRYGARVLMLGAALMISTGTILLGMIRELWHLYVLYGVFVGALGNAAFMVLLPVIMTRWFDKKLGLALGIYWAALGAGPVVFAPLFRWMIESRGWESAFMVIGLGFGAVLLVFSSFIRSSPAEMGMTAYGAEVAAEGTQASAAPAPISLRSVLARRSAPLENAAPEPVKTTTTISSLAAMAVRLSISSSTRTGLNGLRFSGSCSVMMATGGWCSTSNRVKDTGRFS